MAHKDYSSAMNNSEASVRMEGFEVTPEMRDQCQRVLNGETTTTDALMQLQSKREQQSLRNALASTRMEGVKVSEQTEIALYEWSEGSSWRRRIDKSAFIRYSFGIFRCQ